MIPLRTGSFEDLRLAAVMVPLWTEACTGMTYWNPFHNGDGDEVDKRADLGLSFSILTFPFNQFCSYS